MEEALKQWSLVFDDASFNIWHNSPPKLALIQVMFHNLMKQLLLLQTSFNENYIERAPKPATCIKNIEQDNHTPVKKHGHSKYTTGTLPDSKPKENKNISDIDSPDIFKENNRSDMNISDSIFNQNLFDSESPAPDLGIAPSTLISPTINRKKSNKKKKLMYPELNTTDKSLLQDSISTTSSQASLIDFIKQVDISTKSYPRLEITSSIIVNPSEKTLQDISCNSSHQSNPNQSDEPFHRPNLSKIRKRLQNINSFTSKSLDDPDAIVKKVQCIKTENATLNSKEANKSSDATILLSCPDASIEESFFELPKVRATKQIFLSKREQRKLQEEDLDEQNCPRCGNFRGFEDLSPTMVGTKDYKCPKHRKKYMRLNTPEAIWNFGFPDSQ